MKEKPGQNLAGRTMLKNNLKQNLDISQVSQLKLASKLQKKGE